MTYEEAKNLKTFEHYCTCGGYAWTMNGRNPEQPHMNWCPQFREYAEWRAALKGKSFYCPYVIHTNMNT